MKWAGQIGYCSEKKNHLFSGVDYLDNAVKVLYAVDAFRNALEMQEKSRALPENTSAQLATKIKKLTNDERCLADIKDEIKKLQ